MVKIHKKSKKLTTRLRAKITKKVAEHKRKLKRQAKKNPNAGKRRKDPGIPNSLPFKETILKEAEARRQQLDDEKKKKNENRKKERAKLLDKRRSLGSMVQDAQRRSADYDRKQANAKKEAETAYTGGKAVESSLKTFYKEFRKVVEAADVILEVLDARDPLGSRCREMEEAVLGSGTNKRLVLILNKVDLVPRENVEAWLKYLKNEFPVVAFKASTQTQNEHLGRSKVKIALATDDLLKASPCLGADVLMKLLGNYCRNKDIKTVIRVGVVGLPNTGKSSIINSLKRSKTCNVGAVPGVTKQMQEVLLDKHIRLLDSPGVVMATGSSDTSVILRNCVKLESLQDATEPVEAILKRCNKQQIMFHYCIPEFDTVSDFLSLLAKRQGKLRKGGVPDTSKAAKTVLQDWNGGKITFYTHPPEQKDVHVSATVVAEMGKEFDLDSLMSDQQKVLDTLDPTTSKFMLVDSLGPAKVSLNPSIFNKSGMEDDEEFEDEEEEAEEEKMEDDSDLEMEEEDEMTGVTVSIPTSGTRSRSSVASKESATSKKSDQPNAGLPQLNKSRKEDFKKMKKQRKKRDKVAGNLSDALTAAFSFGPAEGEDDDDKGSHDKDDDYNFGEHFS